MCGVIREKVSKKALRGMKTKKKKKKKVEKW